MISLLDYCDAHLHETLDTIDALVRLESPSTDKAAVDRCGSELAARIRHSGGRTELLKCDARGDHVDAAFDGDGPPVLLLGHIDTVWPVGTLDRMPLHRDGDRMFGPGIFDMKAGIAIALAAVQAVAVTGARRPAIRMLWTTDEEIGSATSRAAIEEAARNARAVLVLEPALPGGALKTARKGCGEYELTIEGVAAHAGLDPGKGVSAIHELAAQIRAIEALQDTARGVTVNVGLIEGGTRANVVAERARAVIDARAPGIADARRIDAAMQALKPFRPGARLTIRGGFERPPLERSAAVVRLFELASEVAASLGRPLEEGAAGGGSDGNFAAAVGAPTLDGLGAVGDGAHAAHEHIVVTDLSWRAALVAGLLTRL